MLFIPLVTNMVHMYRLGIIICLTSIFEDIAVLLLGDGLYVYWLKLS
jgi:hypothetical protein